MKTRHRLALAALLLLPFAVFAGVPARADRPPAETQVRKLLADQVVAWNRGDIEAFVLGYAEDALFVSTSGTTRGRADVLARYRRRYPDGKAMGRLTLDVEELRLAAGSDPAGARVLAKWTLEREGVRAG